jgi:hypothetical protein
MADLLSCDLTKLSLKDVDEFLGLSLPENQRVAESGRIEYKEDLPQDLGEISPLLQTGMVVSFSWE